MIIINLLLNGSWDRIELERNRLQKRLKMKAKNQRKTMHSIPFHFVCYYLCNLYVVSGVILDTIISTLYLDLRIFHHFFPHFYLLSQFSSGLYSIPYSHVLLLFTVQWQYVHYKLNVNIKYKFNNELSLNGWNRNHDKCSAGLGMKWKRKKDELIWLNRYKMYRHL